jgi:hypothetical protein
VREKAFESALALQVAALTPARPRVEMAALGPAAPKV